MKLFLNNIKNKRLLFILITILLLSISVINFVRNVSSTTDENLYTNPPSRLYISKNIPLYSVPRDSSIFEGICEIGNLVLSLDNIKTQSPEDIKNYLNTNEKFKQIDSSNEFVDFKYYDAKEKLVKNALVKVSDLDDNFFTYLKSGALILEVFSGGASDRAGIKVGDIITKVNGNTFKDVIESDKYLRFGKNQSTITYTILRNNNEFEVYITLVRFGVNFLQLLSFVVGFIFIGLGAFLCIYRSNINVSVILGFTLIFIGFHLSTQISRFRPDMDFFSIIHLLLYFSTIYYGIAMLIHSLFLFPMEIKEIIQKKWIIMSLYIYPTLLFITFILNYFILHNLLINQFLAFGQFAFIVFYTVIRIIYSKYFTKEYIVLNKVIGRSFVVLLFIVISVNLSLNFFPKIIDPAILTYINSFSLLLIPFSYFYTINKHQLLDIQIRIKRNIQYFIISWLWKISAITFIIVLLIFLSKIRIQFPNLHLAGTTIEVLERPLSPVMQDYYSRIFLVLISIIISVIGWKLKNLVQLQLDKKFYRTNFDYRKASTEFSEILSSNPDLKVLSERIVIEFADLVHLKRCGLIIFRNDNNSVQTSTKICYQYYYGLKSKDLEDLCYASAGNFMDSVQQFKAQPGSSDSGLRVDYLDEPLKYVLRDFGFSFIYPVISNNKLKAIILLGEKKSEATLNRNDFDFMSAISGQISAAIDNAFLYQNLAHQERIKHELEIAKRIQTASLPDEDPFKEGLDISGVSIPAYEVGGDFYDYLNGEEDEFMVIVGDVSGKGTSAALYMSKVQGIMRTLHEFRLSPRKMLIRTNQLLYRYLDKSYFISAVSAMFNLRENIVYYARAGHLPMYHYNSEKKIVERILSKGMVLGLSKDKLFERNLDEIEISFRSGDVFVFITDGVVEARNSLRQEFGEEKLIRLIEANFMDSAESIKNSILSSIDNHTNDEEQFDDITVVVIKIQ